MCKARTIFLLVLLVALIAVFFLPWVVVHPSGKADCYTGFSLASFPIQRYTALALGIFSFIILFCRSKVCAGIALISALVALSATGCFWHLFRREFAGADGFLYGFYIFAAILLLQIITAGCGLFCGKCYATAKQENNG